MALTKIENLIDPEVMAPMISGKISKAIIVTPFAKIDNTLQGQPGDEITVPKYAYIGDADDVAEGVEAGTVTLTATTSKYKVKKVRAVVSNTTTNESETPRTISDVIDDCLGFLKFVNFNGYLVCPSVRTEEDKKKIGDFIINQRSGSNYQTKTVLHNYAGDNEGIINFTSTNLTLKKIAVDSNEVCLDIACMFATLSGQESITYKEVSFCDSCETKENPDSCVNNGELLKAAIQYLKSKGFSVRV